VDPLPKNRVVLFAAKTRGELEVVVDAYPTVVCDPPLSGSRRIEWVQILRATEILGTS
jgi:hypothetical protein